MPLLRMRRWWNQLYVVQLHTYLSWQNEALLADFEWVKISISIQVGNLGEFQ